MRRLRASSSAARGGRDTRAQPLTRRNAPPLGHEIRRDFPRNFPCGCVTTARTCSGLVVDAAHCRQSLAGLEDLCGLELLAGAPAEATCARIATKANATPGVRFPVADDGALAMASRKQQNRNPREARSRRAGILPPGRDPHLCGLRRSPDVVWVVPRPPGEDEGDPPVRDLRKKDGLSRQRPDRLH